ncbi:ribokinase [Micromonospora radicis]|uniref:Ribokinase n=1 Tax=Micromonospora radicis TaxID=1894971 RepID=A0A418MXI7_9ACTN|nr:ribokinase [Micromonospora radicis]RIV39345.1 ribokinase [Micromonospora radicis]
MSPDPATVVVLGSINMDIVVTTPHIPRPGETVLASTARYLPGGKGANQAVAAAQLGGDVVFIGRTGDDDFGDRMRAGLHNAAVRVDHLRALPGEPSGVAFVAVDAHGENVIVVSPGANAQLTPTDLDAHEGVIAQAGIGVAQLETPLPTVARFAELCGAHRVPLILNAAPYQPLPDGLLACCTYLVLNREEVTALTGVPVTNRASARAALDATAGYGVPHVIVTLGGDGCVAHSDGRYLEAEPLPVTVVDSTGAGDTFVGALGAALARGDDLPAALRFATAAGALACCQVGAQQHGISRQDVEDLLRRHQSPAIP